MPTEEQRQIVQLACGIGMTQAQICLLIKNSDTGRPITDNTLREHFPDELADGKARVTARVAGNLVTIATSSTHKGAVAAAIFYLKTQAQWREPEPVSAEYRRMQEEIASSVGTGEQHIEVYMVLEEKEEVPARLAADARAAARENGGKPDIKAVNGG